MTLKPPRSIDSWLFWAGVVLLVPVTLAYALISILAAHAPAGDPSGTHFGVAAIWAAFEIPIGILEFVGLSCLILAALISIFRTILPSKKT